MKYTVEVRTIFEITAENVIEARKLAQKIRAIGECSGAKRLPKNRECIRYNIERLSECVLMNGWPLRLER